jgi:hypothetical protein
MHNAVVAVGRHRSSPAAVGQRRSLAGRTTCSRDNTTAPTQRRTHQAQISNRPWRRIRRNCARRRGQAAWWCFSAMTYLHARASAKSTPNADMISEPLQRRRTGGASSRALTLAPALPSTLDAPPKPPAVLAVAHSCRLSVLRRPSIVAAVPCPLVCQSRASEETSSATQEDCRRQRWRGPRTHILSRRQRQCRGDDASPGEEDK